MPRTLATACAWWGLRCATALFSRGIHSDICEFGHKTTPVDAGSMPCASCTVTVTGSIPQYAARPQHENVTSRFFRTPAESVESKDSNCSIPSIPSILSTNHKPLTARGGRIYTGAFQPDTLYHAMSLNTTPQGERVHIALFGRQCRQIEPDQCAHRPGSRHRLGSQGYYRPVSKAMELLPLGPIMIFDTPAWMTRAHWGAAHRTHTCRPTRPMWRFWCWRRNPGSARVSATSSRWCAPRVFRCGLQ